LIAQLLLNLNSLSLHGVDFSLQLPNSGVVLNSQSLHADIVAQTIAHRL
jgi:hypothetical protein